MYQVAIDERPAHYAPQSLYNMLGEAHVKAGDWTLGRYWYEKALAVKPDHIPAHLTMAHLANKQVRPSLVCRSTSLLRLCLGSTEGHSFVRIASHLQTGPK